MKKLICMLCVCLLSACSSSSTSNIPEGVQVFLNTNNKYHEQLQPYSEIPNTIGKSTISSTEYNSAIQYVIDHSAKTNGQQVISMKEAMEDTNKLFNLLKTLYGRYPIYGEGKFQKAQNMIIETLKEKSTIRKQDFSIVVRKELSFINDRHFLVDFETLKEHPILYKEKGIAYEKSNFRKQGAKFYYLEYASEIVSINQDKNIENVLKPILLKDGKIGYQLYLTSEEKLNMVQIELKSKELLQIPLAESKPYQVEGSTVKENKIDGIPYVRIKRMMYEKEGEEQQKQAEQFLSTANEVANSKVAILDLRGNLGGNSMLIYHWFQEYTKEKLRGNGTRVLHMPMDNKKYQDICDQQTVQYLDELKSYASFEKMNDMTFLEYPRKTKILQKSETVLFVLQDGNSASASEMLIDGLHGVENVIFIGTPTNGSVVGSVMIPFYLEHSGLQIRFGNMAGFFNEEYAKEYTGIQPDIWVDSENCLEYVKYLMKK